MERIFISDAAKQVEVESHVLRYWEEELHLKIRRNKQGHRYYTMEDVNRFKQIKEMKEQGFQLKAIRSALEGQMPAQAIHIGTFTSLGQDKPGEGGRLKENGTTGDSGSGRNDGEDRKNAPASGKTARDRAEEGLIRNGRRALGNEADQIEENKENPVAAGMKEGKDEDRVLETAEDKGAGGQEDNGETKKERKGFSKWYELKAAERKRKAEEKARREKAAREKAEEERTERERKEKEEKERLEKENAAKERAEKAAQEKAEKAEKAAREKAERAEKAAQEKAEKAEKAAREKAERAEKAAREKEERAEKAAREKKEKAAREKEAREKGEKAPGEGGVREKGEKAPGEGGIGEKTEKVPEEGGVREKDEKAFKEGGEREKTEKALKEGMVKEEKEKQGEESAGKAVEEKDGIQSGENPVSAVNAGRKAAKAAKTRNKKSKLTSGNSMAVRAAATRAKAFEAVSTVQELNAQAALNEVTAAKDVTTVADAGGQRAVRENDAPDRKPGGKDTIHKSVSSKGTDLKAGPCGKKTQPKEEIAQVVEVMEKETALQPQEQAGIVGQGEERTSKAARLQFLLQHMITQTVRENNEQLCTTIKETVAKEMDYHFRQQEEREQKRDEERLKREEEHYKKIDQLLRGKAKKDRRRPIFGITKS